MVPPLLLLQAVDLLRKIISTPEVVKQVESFEGLHAALQRMLPLLNEPATPATEVGSQKYKGVPLSQLSHSFLSLLAGYIKTFLHSL